jgi:glycosyltransferase involved in cell wall biosynthesis
VEPDSRQGLAEALVGLLDDGVRRREMGRRAYAFSRHMIWSEVGAAYRQLFSRVALRSARSAEVPVLAANA